MGHSRTAIKSISGTTLASSCESIRLQSDCRRELPLFFLLQCLLMICPANYAVSLFAEFAFMSLCPFSSFLVATSCCLGLARSCSIYLFFCLTWPVLHALTAHLSEIQTVVWRDSCPEMSILTLFKCVLSLPYGAITG